MGDARTVKVRIAVAVDELGTVAACSADEFGDHEAMQEAISYLFGSERAEYFLEAEVKLPTARSIPTIPATVTKAEE